MESDIVARLRDCDGGYGFRGIVCEAADEIERLREALRIEQEELAACCIDRKATQRERDEARQEICLLRASSTNATEAVSQEMTAHAISRGWHELFADEGKHERTT